jgi:hypothetical protein
MNSAACSGDPPVHGVWHDETGVFEELKAGILGGEIAHHRARGVGGHAVDDQHLHALGRIVLTEDGLQG